MKCLKQTPVCNRHPACQLLLFIGVFIQAGSAPKAGVCADPLEAQGISCTDTTAHQLGMGNPEMQQVEEKEAPWSTFPGYTGSPHSQDGAQHFPTQVGDMLLGEGLSDRSRGRQWTAWAGGQMKW